MKTASTKSYLLLFAALFLLMSLSISSTEKARGIAISLFSSPWDFLSRIRESFTSHSPRDLENKWQQLQIENQLLHAEIDRLQQLLEYNADFKHAAPTSFQSIQGRVIFRSPSSWNSSLWINIGEADNPSIEDRIIAKNSPVLLGGSVIGVIDYVGEHQSRVRLITDSGLTPSVRAVRGSIQYKAIENHIVSLISALERKKDISISATEKTSLIQQLNLLNNNLKLDQQTLYLSKGELHGTGQPLWRTKSSLLKGVGFNYDFADEYGDARDLRTGKIANKPSSKPIPLLKVNDLLITTGMDGVFPEGLKVAEVTKIDLLKEGDYFYNLEAKPTAGNLDDIFTVFVIPPLGYNPADKPPALTN